MLFVLFCTVGETKKREVLPGLELLAVASSPASGCLFCWNGFWVRVPARAFFFLCFFRVFFVIVSCLFVVLVFVVLVGRGLNDLLRVKETITTGLPGSKSNRRAPG